MAAPHPSMQMSLACFSYVSRLAIQQEVVLSKGIVSLHHPEKLGIRQRKIAGQQWPNELVEAINASDISKLANLKIEQDGFIQSAGQVINPLKLTKLLV